MSNLTLVTPLRIERAFVRRGVDVPVQRTGMGVRRATLAAANLTGDGPLALLGVAGGVAPQVQVGDVVVASEVRGDGITVGCPTAPLLAGALRRAGLRVHVGPIATRQGLTRPAEAATLAAAGVLAVDMETAPVASAAGGRPFAAVRVVSDTVAAPLWRPAILRNGVIALRTLQQAAAVVASWGAVAGDRRVLLASPRSFCAGVERAIEIVERSLERFGAPVYVRRQIVHNAYIVRELEDKGAVFVEELDEVPDGARVIFAAHGVSAEVRDDADRRGLSVVDATCPLVAKVHSEVRRHAARGRTVFLIGHRDHEEVVGTVGEAPDRVIVVDGPDEAREVNVADPTQVAYAMQTTLSVEEGDAIAATLRDRFPALLAPPSDDICYATSNRQAAVRDIAAECDLLIVVGSANSSNSRRLVEVAERAGVPAHLVDGVGDVELRWLHGARTVGITAGASAPPHLVDELVSCLRGLGDVHVEERDTVTENVAFTLPREVS
jgi:4-hydroxy-3-methylbut-2-enyl diphosphate reductase